MKRAFSFLLPFVLLGLIACSDDSDQSQPRTQCGISFYDAAASSNTALNIDSLTIRVIQPDSTFYSAYSGNYVALPLRYIGNTSQFEFTRGDRQPDTLTVVHKNTPRFISMEAGYAMYYELLEVYSTQYSIDTVAVRSTTITKNEQENIAIYYPQY